MSIKYGIIMNNPKHISKELKDMSVNFGYNFWNDFLLDIEEYYSSDCADFLDNIFVKEDSEDMIELTIEIQKELLKTFSEILLWINKKGPVCKILSINLLALKYEAILLKLIEITDYAIKNKLKTGFWE